MAEAAQQELSPEEKLLRVIQGGGEARKPEAPAKVAPPVAVPAAPPPRSAPVSAPAPAPAPTRAPTPAPAPVAARVPEPEPEVPPETVPPAVAPPPPQKPRLKLVPPPQPPPSRTAVESPPSAPPKAVKMPAQAEPPAREEPKVNEAAKEKEPEKPREEAKSGGKSRRRSRARPAPPVAAVGKPAAGRPGGPIRTANRILALIILILLGLCGFQIWSGAAAGEITPPPPEAPAFEDGAGEFELPAIAALQGAFREKQIWDFGTPAGPGPGPGPEPPPPPQPEIEKVLRLIGLSAPPGAPAEQIVAVVLDSRDGKMYFVKIGEKLPFNGREFDVETVSSDQVVLADGSEKIRIR